MDRKTKIESMLLLNNSNIYAINEFRIHADGFEITNNNCVCFYHDILLYEKEYRLYSLVLHINDIHSIDGIKV